jgi:phosphatidylglycerol:prolipoprotein diacylglycerol transferase
MELPRLPLSPVSLLPLLSAASAATASASSHMPLRWDQLGLSPIAWDFGFFALRWYSLAYLAGILVGYWHLSRMIRQPGAPMAQRHADDLFFYATLGIILGGRLGYATFYAPELWTHPSEMIKLWQGGMSFHGGLIGTVCAIAFVCWRNRLSFIRVCDYIAPCAPIGLFFGRCANFMNGELWGRVTTADVPWAMVFPGAGPNPRHPSQLYEALLEGVLLATVLITLFWKTRARWRPGLLMGTFATGYALSRFIVEFYREPDAQLEDFALRTGLSMGQWLTLPMLAIGLALLVRALVRPPLGATALPPLSIRKTDSPMASEPLIEVFARLIQATGPISVAHFMAESNARYYTTRDPLGHGGDFITAPEISQMFGEMIGLWLADVWIRAGRPEPVAYVEAGPGRGTLAQDALRAAARQGLVPQVHFVETSPALRALQRQRFPQACWHDDFSTLPGDCPLLIVGNEFLDALPVRQIVRMEGGWRERMVGWQPEAGTERAPGEPESGATGPPAARGRRPPDGCRRPRRPRRPARRRHHRDLPGCQRRRRRDRRKAGRPGRHGPADRLWPRCPHTGSTLQAVRAHQKVDPFATPGEADLTALVDFSALVPVAQQAGARRGIVPQGPFLQRLGIEARAQGLARSAPDHAQTIARALARLVAPEEMGNLFKAMAVSAPHWPAAAGFETIS